MTARWPRCPDESDDTYYMRVYRAAERMYPGLEVRLLHYGTCIETRLPCVHPFPLREYHSPLGTMMLPEFIASEPPNRWRGDKAYRDRVMSMTQCTVCDTWWPCEPFDICRERKKRLALILKQSETV